MNLPAGAFFQLFQAFTKNTFPNSLTKCKKTAQEKSYTKKIYGTKKLFGGESDSEWLVSMLKVFGVPERWFSSILGMQNINFWENES